MAFGRLFWETGKVPYQDVFSYAPTKEIWIYHEWLTGILFYPIFTYAGNSGLQGLKLLLGIGTVALVGATATRRGADVLGLFGIIFTISGFLTLGYSPVRAQIFTYFFFVLTLFLLESVRKTNNWRQLGWLVPIQLIWCNLHGGFLAGLGLVALYALGEAFSRRIFWPYVLALVFSGLATLINPYGLSYWLFIFQAISMPRPEIIEWCSVVTAWQNGIYHGPIYYFAAVTIFGILLMYLTQFKDITAILALVVTWYVSFIHLRHQVFFYLLMGAYLAEPLSVYLSNLRTRLDGFPICGNRRLLMVVYLMICSLFSYRISAAGPLRLTTPTQPTGEEKIYYPVGAVAFIKSHLLGGKLLSEFNWGEYLLWELHPQCQIAMDGRYETVYPETVVRSYMNFSYAKPGWQDFLAKFPPDMILLPKNKKIFEKIQESGEWRRVYHDESSGLFVRQAKNIKNSG